MLFEKDFVPLEKSLLLVLKSTIYGFEPTSARGLYLLAAPLHRMKFAISN